MLKIFVAVCMLCGSLVNGLCFQSSCRLNPFSDDFCCDDGSCCTESQYDAENVVGTIKDLLSCTKTTCKLNPFTDDFCCDDGTCCTESEYDAENAINFATDTLGSGALVGICAGATIFVVICVVICFFLFRKLQTNQGTVIHNGTAGAQTQGMQQYPLGSHPPQTYPPVGGYDPTVKPYSIPNQNAEHTF